MTRVIHTGDTHLGYRQYHSPERRQDFLDAFRQIVEDAIAEDVDAVVHAGDLFHDRSPALADVHGAIHVLRELRDADIPFLAVVGNHERTREGQWIDLFATLGLATRLDETPTVVGDVAFYGLDYVPPSQRERIEYTFEDHEASFAALVAHGPFDPFVPEVRTDRWDLPAVLAEATVEFDAALLGDDHTPDTQEIDGTWATYCGSTERTDASERADRGYNIVEFDEDVRISRRGLDTRRFVLADLELASGEGIDRVRERLREENLEEAVVVVRITGEGEPVAPARVEEFAAERGALVARVSDRRDIETAEETPEVSFADPDEAVRQRVRQLGLSAAAETIDETVRDDAIADANVRDRVRERIEALIEEDPAALEPHEIEADDPPIDEEDTAAPGAEPEPGETTAEAVDEHPVEEEPTVVASTEGSTEPEDGDAEQTASDGATTIEDFL